jgi:hypothetical protein
MTQSPTVCYRHPQKETSLRCNRCEKYICAQCARRTPTGYRCPDCIREQKKVFVTAEWYDYITGFFTAFVLSMISTWLMNLISRFGGFFLIFIIFAIATGAGALIAEVVRMVIGKRRARSLFITAAAGVALGGIAVNLNLLLAIFFTGNFFALTRLLWPALFIFLATTSTYVRLSGIQIGR